MQYPVKFPLFSVPVCLLLLCSASHEANTKQITPTKLKDSKIYNIKVPFDPKQFLTGLDKVGFSYRNGSVKTGNKSKQLDLD